VAVVASAVTVALVAVSPGYGYHRDELYFRTAGRHLDWGYPDQPPITPLLARAASELFGDSLVGLRAASAVAAGLVVLLCGLITRELGGDRAAQALAAGCMAVASYLLAVGHTLSTSTFDLLAWAALSWAVVRALRVGGWAWPAVGVIGGLGLQNKTLLALLLAGLLAGVLAAGPREVLRGPGPWVAAGIAAVLWAPNLAWQATHGWPLLTLSSAIAAGSSISSQPRWLFLPFQLVLVSPLLVPVWAAGLWRLARDPSLRRYRTFAVAYPLLAVVLIAAGGKPYYLAGLYPVLLAAGAEPTLRWVRGGARGRGRASLRGALLGAALVVSAMVNGTLMLPLVPERDLASTPVVAVYPDAGETVGWPAFVRTVAAVRDTLPPAERASAVLLTRNYGEAGAIDRFGPPLGLPNAYSGHNSYAEWGPPPEAPATVIAVGYQRADLQRWFGSVEQAARIDNGIGLRNDEQGAPVWVCRQRLAPWASLWPQLRHIG
jgi:4-amino-4-deoxy-L-arabinose transferase-like glycosyltransferase